MYPVLISPHPRHSSEFSSAPLPRSPLTCECEGQQGFPGLGGLAWCGVSDVGSSCKQCCLLPQRVVQMLFHLYCGCVKSREVRQTDPYPLLLGELFRQLGLVRISEKLLMILTLATSEYVCRPERDTGKTPLVRTKRFANAPGFLWYALMSTNALCEAWIVIAVVVAGAGSESQIPYSLPGQPVLASALAVSLLSLLPCCRGRELRLKGFIEVQVIILKRSISFFFFLIPCKSPAQCSS